MIKFADKHYQEEVDYSDSYNYHPYTSYTSPEGVVNKFGWKECRVIVLRNIQLGYSSKMNLTNQHGLQIDFFCCDLQHLLSYYYDDIPRYYNA